MEALKDSMTELSQRAKAAEERTTVAAKETGEQVEIRLAEVKDNALRMRNDLRSRPMDSAQTDDHRHQHHPSQICLAGTVHS
jgi:hypothetical protein